MEIEKTIDLKDLFEKVLLKWRIILLWMILGAVILCGFGVVRKYRASRLLTIPVEETEDLEELEITLREKLSELEIEEVEWALSVYETYSQKYKSLQVYNDNSIYMNIDPYHVATMQLDYYIQADYEEGDSEILENARRGDIRAAYLNKLQDESIYTGLIAELGENLTENNIKELITLDSGTANLSINVIADTKGNAEKIASYVQKAVENMTPELQKVYGDFELVSYNSVYAEKVDTSISTQQQAQINALITLKNSITNLKNGFSEDQKAYYELRIKTMDEKSGVEEETESETPSAENVIDFSLVKAISLKYILIGAILGAFCVCLWYMLLYFIGGKLHVKSEMEEYYKISVLGNLKCDCVHMEAIKGIDKVIYSIFGDVWSAEHNETQMRLIYEKIRLFSAKNEAKKVFISGAYRDDTVNKIMDQMNEMLKHDIVIVGSGSVNNDPDALKQMAYSDAVVLVETVGKSSYNDIQKEVEQCRVNEVPIIGCVVLE